MSSEADKALTSAVLSQIEVGKIDYDKLAYDLSLPSKAAASMRWSRFKARLNIAPTPRRAVNVMAATPPQATPSKSGKGKKTGPSSKRRKMAMSDNEDGDDDCGLDLKGKPVGDDENGDWETVIPETLSRKLPLRKDKAAKFMEEEYMEDGDSFEEAFAASLSRHGSTTAEGSDGISEN